MISGIKNQFSVVKSRTKHMMNGMTDDDNAKRAKLEPTVSTGLQSRRSANSTPVKMVIRTLGPTVRKKADRQKLNGFACKECEDYYKARYPNATPEELQTKLNKCSRHRAEWQPYRSPEHFWDTDFPTDEECVRRGIFQRHDSRRVRPKTSANTTANTTANTDDENASKRNLFSK